LTLYQQRSFIEHIFAIIQLTSVGKIKMKFGSRTRNIFGNFRYENDSNNVTGCTELQWKADAD